MSAFTTSCRHGDECYTKACPFRHGGDNQYVTPCRHAEKCHTKGCPYKHPRWHSDPSKHPSEVNCRYGDICKNRNSACPYRH